MRTQRFMAVFVARNREFMRDRSSMTWNLLMPVLVVLGFAFAFVADKPELYKVGLYGEQDAPAISAFVQTDYLQFIPVDDVEASVTKVERHLLDMLVDTRGGRYWVNETSPRGYILERVLAGTSHGLQRQAVSGEQVRYVDWLIPGVLGMNMMFSALFGVGYVIVRYRKNGVLKRLKATPLNAFEFLSAQVVSRLWLIILINGVVYAGTNLLVDFRMYGSYLDLLVVWAVGAFSLISLGLLVAARISNEETANGLLNLFSWPMMLMSGVWFSLEGSPAWVQALSQALPLTHVTEAARRIMIDGAGLVEVWPHVLVLLAMSVVFMILGSYSFKWE